MNRGGCWFLNKLLFLCLVASGRGQAPPSVTPTPRAVRPIGVVTAINLAAKQIALTTDAGPQLTVLLEDGTTFLHVAPGQKDLKDAAKIEPSEITVGDRILVRGKVTDDQKAVVATSLIVMTKADLTKKHEADRAEWRKRGAGGTITAIQADAKEVTISAPVREGPKTLTIALNSAVLRRYAPDSVRFSDAKLSTFAELNVGDQVRALGDPSPDGTHFTAEQMVSGSFQNSAGTVTSVDPTRKTITLMDLTTKKPLLVRISGDSNLRKIPPPIAQMLAARRAGQSGPRDNAKAQEAPPDAQQLLERAPVIAVTDLKAGDAVIVASTVGADPTQVTAITLLAGVEPLLAGPRGSQQAGLGSWNLDLNMNINVP